MTERIDFGDLNGRFGIIKLWPGISVAEDECIARIKDAADHIGLECVVVDYFGLPIDKELNADAGSLDFVLSIHFERPKLYPFYSYYAIWNPTQFYFDWGYERVSRNAASHDAFLTSDGTASVAMIQRILSGMGRSDAQMIPFYPSISSHRCLQPTLGSQKLFYCGINWDRGGNIRNKGRHHDLLKRLDDPRHLEIYGPEKLFDVRVWEGFDSYVGELAFDGVSLLEAANKAGIVLALSSAAHKESGIVSNRLWEGLAAGAFIICDQPEFGRRHFGENLAYVDSDLHSAKIAEQILFHLDWVRANPEAALEKARAAQQIFLDGYALEKGIARLYEHQAQIRSAEKPTAEQSVSVILVAVEFDEQKFATCLRSVDNQSHENLKLTIVLDEDLSSNQLAELNIVLRSQRRPFELFKARYLDGGGAFRGMGAILKPLIGAAAAETGGFTLILGQNEELLPNHIEAGLGALIRSPDAAVAVSDLIRLWPAEPERHQDIGIDFSQYDPVFGSPASPARFLVRNSAIPKYFDNLVIYLHGNPLLPVALFEKTVRTGFATVVREFGVDQPVPKGLAEGLMKDRFLFRDYMPGRFTTLPDQPYSDGAVVLSEILHSLNGLRNNLGSTENSSASTASHYGGAAVLVDSVPTKRKKFRKRYRAVNHMVHTPRDFLRWVRLLFRAESWRVQK